MRRLDHKAISIGVYIDEEVVKLNFEREFCHARKYIRKVILQ